MTQTTKARVTITMLVAAVGAAVALVGHRSLAGRWTQFGFDDDWEQEAAEAGSGEAELPPALGQHIERLSRALPGNSGESREGPGAYGDAHFEALAYPDTDIPLVRLNETRRAFGRVLGRGYGRGGRRGDAWVSVGPSEALYPASDFRNSSSYVPAEYVAGGRATALAIDPNCGRRAGRDDEDDDDDDPGRGFGDRGQSRGRCRLWMFAAGGGVWRTDNALSGRPRWRFVSGAFGMNSGSALALDPNDPDADTIYAGTGEANASGDSAAGAGLYKSTNGGNTWTGPIGAAVFAGRAIASIAIAPGAPNVLYVATTRGVAGVSSVSGGAVSLIPGAAPWGLYKSTDGGATWTFLHNGAPAADQCDTVAEATAAGTPCSLRGVRRIALDPGDPATVYASSYSRGVWRSADGGATWAQIYTSLNAADANMRAEFAVTALAAGTTRMYVYEGSTGASASTTARLFRSDDATAATPAFVGLTSNDPADPGYATYNLCTGQCWYDNFVYTPAGHPDVVYIGGSYSYGEAFSNKRGVVLSTDAGVSATDMTMDATDPVHPNGLHPDQHALVTNPGNPFQFFEVNDGGLMRSNGAFADASAWCDDRSLADPQLSRCRQLLSRVPAQLTGLNRGLQTLQFQSLSLSPFNPRLLQGGTQDNGTWQSTSRRSLWRNTMIGDGGQSGFDAAVPNFRFHTFFNATPDINLSDGAMAAWNWIGDQIFGTEPQAFYVPIITDPKVSRTMFVGTGHVWRTKTWGMGTSTPDEHTTRCNEWFGVFDDFCGDWLPMGAVNYVPLPFPNLPAPSSYSATRLTASGALYGTDRAGGNVAAIERAAGDTSTLWAATSTGRVFISTNVDAEPFSAVTYTRLDSLAANDPNRFVTGIYVDPADANHAWIAYSGFSATTPTTPGHVFDVRYDPNAGTATWTDVSFDLGDIPITDVVRDDLRGDLYAASDFGVYRLLAGDDSWTLAAAGMPAVEVAGLTIHGPSRRLYAATHGLGAWLLTLR
ncbi:MAG: sialidase family protein [Vicinamibacterales bacterium]